MVKAVSTRTYYTVHSFSWVEPKLGQTGYWSASGSGPGGNTLEEAYARIKKDAGRIGAKNINKVKFKIEKTIETTEPIEELSGTDLTALILRTT